jgi:D-3-phosphoglycerate dehydrogenase
LNYRILALEGITDRGLALLRAEGWSVDTGKALSPPELRAKLPPYHGLLVRSGTAVDSEALDGALNLRVIGRPGVGVDNVDLDAATRRGVVVMNSPGGNIASTAELAVGLLIALARNIPQADASMKAGIWDRKSFVGTELQGKRLGILGFGRIGREVALRCRVLGMDVVSYDPFVSGDVADKAQVRLLGLDELLLSSDFLTLHTTLSPESRHLLGKQAFAKIKPGVRIVNAARGELIDDEALLAALDSGRVAGAALDVHSQEPPTDWRLAQHPRVVATPHLGAGTFEAQERVGTDIAIQVRDFLKGGVIQNAVNFFSLSGDLYDRVRPAMDLAERLGLFVAQVCEGALERVELGLYGELRELDVKPLLSAALTGILRPSLGEGVTLVNAASLARERGIGVVESTSSAPLAFANLMGLRLKTAESELSVTGTLFGRNHLRLVDVDGVEVDAIPQGHVLYVKNDDTPGVIGQIGSLLGRRSVNIARMTVGRKPGSGRAVMLIELDNAVPAEALAELRALAGIREARAIRLG